MFVNPFSVKNSRLAQLSAYFDRGDALRFVRFALISQLPALMELAVAAIIALVAAVFSSSEKVAEYAPIASLIKYTGWDFLNDQRYLAFALLIALWAAMLLKNATNMLQAYMGAMFAENCSRKLTLRIMQFFLRAPWHWHLTKGVVDLNFTFTSAGHIGVLLTTISQAIANGSVILFLFVGLLVAAPGLSLGLFAVAGFSALCIVRGIKRYFDSLNSSIYAKQLEMSRASYFALHGMKEARLHRREDAIYEDYRARSQGLMRANALRTALSRLPVSLIESIAFLLLPLMMYVLLEIQGASMTKVVAIMGFLAGAAWRVLPAVNRLVDNAMQLRTFTPYLNNVLDRLQEAEDLHAQIIAPDATANLPFAHELRVNAISYTYPKSSNPTLMDVSLSIAKGSMVGIVGLSGAGKSTLVALLTGLLQPSRGDISIDECPLTPDLYAAWRAKLGYVPQSPFIFNDTIAANIALSDWGGTIDRERVQECCTLAALDFIADLEDGIDALVGDRGMRLSGGQTQRLAIARALYDRPEVLIFDEATSSLDSAAEESIQQTVLALGQQVTVIMVAHRLSTVQQCDVVYWLDVGQVRQHGKPKEALLEYEEFMRTLLVERQNAKGVA